MAITTPEQYEVVRAQMLAYERQQAEAKAAEEAAALLQIRQFTNSAAYKEVLAALPAIKAAYRDDTRFAVFLNNLEVGLPTLADRAGPLPVTPPAPEEPTDGEGE